MFKTISVCLLILAAVGFTTMAQTATKQWEYLVFYENTSISLNDLGQKGWELAGLTSSEGSSIRYIFKRPYDVERSRQEAELKKTNEQNRQEQVEFVNLDKVEEQSSQKEDEEKAKYRIEQAIKSIKEFSIVSLKPYAWFPSINDRRVGGEVIIDGSKELLKDGNKYRSSEVDKFIRQAANKIYKAAGLKPRYANQETFGTDYDPNANGVNIKLAVVVNYKGIVKTLAEGIVQGDWEQTQ
jgi:hypothetical protein